jgi:cytoskeletal protein CcmA (bactofilin family)
MGLGTLESRLTRLEKEMVAAAATGELVERGEGPFALAEMQAWGEDRTVSAGVVQALLVGADSAATKSVRLRGITIKGHLDLEAASFSCPLRLDGCYLDGPCPVLSYATVALLELSNCHLAGLAARSLTVSRTLDLSGSTFTYPIDLMEADIAGDLDCIGAHFNSAESGNPALMADGLKVGGSARFSGSFVAAGAMRLAAADIRGQLDFGGAHLNGVDGDGNALTAFIMKIGGDMILEDPFSAAGAIDIRGSDIGGHLSCRGARLNGHSYAERNALTAYRMKVGSDVQFDAVSTENGGVRLTGTQIAGQLSCRGARLMGQDRMRNALYADSVAVGGRVVMSDGFVAAGTVRLPGANITGPLRCRGAVLDGKDEHGRALLADQIKVGGGASFREVDVTRGAIRMVGADITGNFRCDHVRLGGTDEDLSRNDRSDNALVADLMTVRGRLTLYHFRTVQGAIRLPSAHVTGRVRLGNVQLDGADSHRRALLADGMMAGGGVWLGGVRTARGAIRMVGADITGDFICNNVALEGVDECGRTLVADLMRVTGGVVLGPGQGDYRNVGSAADGAVSLRSASIGGSLELEPERLAEGKDSSGLPRTALDLAGAQIACDLVWKPWNAISGVVILEDAKVGQLKDDRNMGGASGYWPSASHGQLRLDGFTYNRISEKAGTKSANALRERLEWLGSPYRRDDRNNRTGFATQPYEQLVAVYRRAGQDTEARKVAIARRRDLRRYGDLSPYRRVSNWLLDNSIRYGYRTWRAVAALVFLYVAACVIFYIAQHHGNLMIPTMWPAGKSRSPIAADCTSSYPCFYPAAYAIDTVVPIVDVHQATYWSANGQAPWGQALEAFTWVSTVLGWALATLVVAGYTGLVRRD